MIKNQLNIVFMSHEKIDLLKIVADLREEEIKSSLGEISNLSFIKSKIKTYCEDIFLNLEVKRILNSIDTLNETFQARAKEILGQETLDLEDTRESIESLYKKMYSLDDIKGKFQCFYDTVAKVEAVLKIIRNSFNSILFTLDNELFDRYVGSAVKTKSGKDDIITSLQYDLDAYLLVLDNYKALLYRNVTRIDGIVNILLKQESSIRLLYRDIANVDRTERSYANYQ